MNAKTAARSLKYFSTGFRCLECLWNLRHDWSNRMRTHANAMRKKLSYRPSSVFVQLCDKSHAKNAVMTMHKRLLAIRKQVELGWKDLMAQRLTNVLLNTAATKLCIVTRFIAKECVVKFDLTSFKAALASAFVMMGNRAAVIGVVPAALSWRQSRVPSSIIQDRTGTRQMAI